MKKKILVFVIIVLAVTASIWFKFKPNPTPIVTTAIETQEQKSATVVLAYSEEDIKEFEYDFSENKTAFDALKETLEKQSITLETQKYDFGVFVKSINAVESSAQKAWIYYINGKSADTASDQYQLQDGDVIEWKYVKPI